MNRPELGPGLVLLVVISIGCASPMMQDAPLMSQATPGKALVKIHRPGGYAGVYRFPLWDGGKLIGESAAGYTVQYECEPGEHLFIADSEDQNMSAVRAHLEAGNVYNIVAKATFGFSKAGVKLLPVTPDSPYKRKLESFERKLRPAVLDPAKAAEYEARRRPWMLKTIARLERGELDQIVSEFELGEGRLSTAKPVAPEAVAASKPELDVGREGITLEFEDVTRRESGKPLKTLIGVDGGFTFGVAEDVLMSMGSVSVPVYFATRPFPRGEGSTNGLLARAGVGAGSVTVYVPGAPSVSASATSWNASASYFWARFKRGSLYPDKVTGKGFYVGVAVMGTESEGIRTTSDPSPEFGFDMFNFNPGSEKWYKVTIMILPIEDMFFFGVTASRFF